MAEIIPTSASRGPVTAEAFIADRQTFWTSFTRFAMYAVVAVIALLVLMTIFLV